MRHVANVTDEGHHVKNEEGKKRWFSIINKNKPSSSKAAASTSISCTNKSLKTERDYPKISFYDKFARKLYSLLFNLAPKVSHAYK